MTTNIKIPFKKNKEEIETYQSYGKNFGNVLLDIRNKVQNKKFSSMPELVTYYMDTLPAGFRKYPFAYQKNSFNEMFKEPICISINNCIAHGRDYKRFKDGDVISIDCGVAIPSCNCNRYLNFDAAFTVVYGEEKSWTSTPLEALKNIVAKQPKNTYDLAGIISDTAIEKGLNYVVSLTGHGIGYSLHETPIIHNARGAFVSENLFEGLCFCAEPIFVKNKSEAGQIEKTYLDSDGWAVYTQSGSPSSHFETMFCVINGQIVDLLGMTQWVK